jgi:hypothetical protein
MTFIGSSYFIEELGDKDVDLEMPKILFGKISRKSIKHFSRA